MARTPEKARGEGGAVTKRRTIGDFAPALKWAPRYTRAALADDLLAAIIVTVMLIPQSLAYALIAGLPPEAGLYASILPLVAYAIFGTSTALAVGPVAVVSLMTAATVGDFAAKGADYAEVTLALAFIVGLILTALGALRLGFLANFLSHPIISGFITASGVLIAAGQVSHILGVKADGDNLVDIIVALARSAGDANLPTFLIGAGVIAFLFWSRSALKPLFVALGVKERAAALAARAAPLLAVIATIALTAALGLPDKGVAIVGATPKGLPPFAPPDFDWTLWRALVGPALLIAIIGYVESVSIAQTLAAKRDERIDLDQELIALGASNVAAGVSGGFPVTGGFARSVVNFDAGARTPAAGAFTAIGIAVAALLLLVATTPAVAFFAGEHVWRRWGLGPSFGQVFADSRFPAGKWHAVVASFTGVEAEKIDGGSQIGFQLEANIRGLRELTDVNGPAVIVLHSASGVAGFTFAQRHPERVRAIVAIEPVGCPSQSLKVPVLTVFGDHLEVREQIALRQEECRKLAESTAADGIAGELWSLSALGIKGNSHLMMMEDNSRELSARISIWLTKAVGKRR